MTFDDIVKFIESKMPDEASRVEGKMYLFVSSDNWIELSTLLKNASDLDFDYLMCIPSLDLENNQLGLAYNIHSTKNKISIEFKLLFNQETTIPSVESLWKTANWHEREAFDMMGIKFLNHPDMKRILLPQDWEGHPLRKDYVVQDYYHGMYIPKDKTSWE